MGKSTKSAKESRTYETRKAALAHDHGDADSCWMCTRGRCVHCKAAGIDPAYKRYCTWCGDMLSEGGTKPIEIVDTGKHDYRNRKVKTESYRDVGFPRPELGVDNAARRRDEYLAERRRTDKAGLTCNADRFCNGTVVAYKMCGAHLRVAAKAGSLGKELQELATR